MKPRNQYYDVIHVIRHCWQHIREKMPTFPKSKSIFEPKIYIPAFAGITYEECIVPHNSPREDTNDGPDCGMITDLMNSKCECPSATISQNEMIRQQDSMCEILQITTKLVQQDQNFLVDYDMDSTVSCHSYSNDSLYYDQFARNEKEQTCRETSPVSEIQSKFARNEKKKTCREVSPKIQPKIARNENVQTCREVSQKRQPSWRVDRRDLQETLKYSTTPVRQSGLPCFRRPGSSLLLSSPNTPQTQQLCCNKNLQMQVPHKAGNSPMYLPLNNVYHYDINTEKIVNQSQRGVLPTVFPKNANAKRKETKKDGTGISRATLYEVKQLILQFPFLEYSPDVENVPRNIPYSYSVAPSCEIRRDLYRKKSSSALPRL